MLPVDWRRFKSGSRCEKCLQLDLFLDAPLQKDILISEETEAGVRHVKSQLPHIDHRYWRQVPEHEMKVESNFALRIYKTEEV